MDSQTLIPSSQKNYIHTFCISKYCGFSTNLIFGIFSIIISVINPDVFCFTQNNNNFSYTYWLLINGIATIFFGFIISSCNALSIKTEIPRKLLYVFIVLGLLSFLFNFSWFLFGSYLYRETNCCALYANFIYFVIPLGFNILIILPINLSEFLHMINMTFYVRKNNKCVICFENDPNDFICSTCSQNCVCNNCKSQITSCPLCRTLYSDV